GGFWRRPRRGPGDAARRNHVAAIVTNGRGDAHHADLALLVLDRAAALARGAERFDEFLRTGDGLRRARLEAGLDDAIDDVIRLKGEDRLSFGRAIGGLAHADIGTHADRMGALEIVDVHDLGLVEDCKMHALVDFFAQIVE